MKSMHKSVNLALASALAVALELPVAQAAGNPCSGNPSTPCAAKNPCAAGGKIDPKLITRPKGYQPYKGNKAELVKEGERLWNDTKLSTNGLSCNTCHQNHASFAPSFAQPYPHTVAMAQERAGLKKIHLDEMIQACMVIPMAAKPLPWGSKELAALTAYTAKVQKTFKPGKAAAQNPCAAKNPCAARK